jgi:oligopeptide/dipeptide ABC transporter ATP-binding protein
LIDAVPSVKKRRLPPILPIGEPPNPIALPGGCRFHPRCPKVGDLCRRISPELDARAAGHQVACHYA